MLGTRMRLAAFSYLKTHANAMRICGWRRIDIRCYLPGCTAPEFRTFHTAQHNLFRVRRRTPPFDLPCKALASGSMNKTSWLEMIEEGKSQEELEAARQNLERIVSNGQEGDEWQNIRLALGCMAASGLGGKQDLVLAERCLLSVAESGNPIGMFRLAELYLPDEGENPDEEELQKIVEASSKREESALPGQQQVDPVLAKAVKKQIVTLIRQVKLAKQRGEQLTHIESVKPPVIMPPPTDANPSSSAQQLQPPQHGGSEQGPSASSPLRDLSQAEHWLRRAAAAGHADAQVLLGNLLVSGALYTPPPARTCSAAGGVVDVTPAPAAPPPDHRSEESLREEGLTLYRAAAAAGHPDAMFNLGLLLYEGRRGVERDVTQALRYLRAAAEAGDATALYWLGYAHHSGDVPGVDRDEARGVALVRRAAEFDHPAAAYYLAMHLRAQAAEAPPPPPATAGQTAAGQTDGGRGDGNDISEERGGGGWREWLQRAGELGDSEALFCLGDLHYHGSEGFQVDHRRAFRFFAAAGRAGHREALCSLGAMLYNGQGVKKDLERAFAAYQLAAEKGSVPAMRNLAAMHFYGEGCTANQDTAKYLLKVAAEAEAEAHGGGGGGGAQ